MSVLAGCLSVGRPISPGRGPRSYTRPRGSGVNASHWAPGGPFLTRPGLLRPCARATTEQPRGQNGHIKNDLER